MFTKKDYLQYFDELLEKEILMKKEAEILLRLINDNRAQEILKNIISDEVRHAKLVKYMRDLI